MKIDCLAVDDEKPALQLVKSYIEQVDFLNLRGCFHNPVEAMNKVKEWNIPLLFLDINMPDLSGTQLARLLPPESKVIFTTAYEEYALEGFKVSALDYLVKPFSLEEFMGAAQKAFDYFQLLQASHGQQVDDYLFVKADYKLHKVWLQDILFVENLKDYVRFYLEDGTRLMSLVALKTLEERLPKVQFMKVHRSYIVNLAKVSTVERSRIVFGNHFIPISDPYRPAFKAYLEQKRIN